MKKIFKKIFMILLFSLLIFFTSRNVYAALDPTSIVDSGPSTDGTNSLYDIGNIILGIFQVIGIGCAMIALLVLGIRYMYSAPDEKAEVKKKLIPFVVGGFLVFGATSFIKIIETFTSNIHS